MLVRIGIDGGGGFLKICMSIFGINYPFPQVKNGIAKMFKESGVKKVFVIGLVADVPENYVNVKRLWLNADRKFEEKIYRGN